LLYYTRLTRVGLTVARPREWSLQSLQDKCMISIR